jgi:hypothetical protein
MRLGLFSSLAALLAGGGLAIGQAPETFVVPAHVAPAAPQKAPRGLLRPASHTTVMQQPAPALQPVPGPVVQPATISALDVTTAPLVPDVCDAPIYESQMYRCWAKAEYILWRFGSVLLPSFQSDVASGNIVVFSRSLTIDSLLGPTSTIDRAFNIPVSVTVDMGLPGGQNADLRDQPGCRVTAGWWVDSAQEWGWEASFFWLANVDVGFTNGVNLIGQTVQLESQFDQTLTTVTTSPGGDTNSETITSPLFVAADVNTQLVGRASNQVWGVEASARRRLAYFGPASFDLIGGVRFIEIKQEASVLETIVLSPTAGAGQGVVDFDPVTGQPVGIVGQPADQLFLSTATLLGTVSTVLFDSISVKNDYYLAQIGGSFEWDISERFFVAGVGKLGFGGVRQTASLVGLRTQTFTPNPAQAAAGEPLPPGFNNIGGSGTAAAVTGGLLVAPQDNGVERTVDRIAFVPEANISMGWRCSPGLSFMVGYNVIHFSNVAKVGNITTDAPVSTTVNFGEQRVTQQVVQPGFRFGGQKSNLQGISLAAELRY